MVDSNIDISVIIATYNRGEILKKTLENLTNLNREGISVEYIVINNNSSDNTKEVIESFYDRLPIRYIFESRQGKNYALNTAIENITLGKLVLFTDDDIEPQKDWLHNILAVSARWPQYSIFGGMINPIWPDMDIPKWADIPWIASFAFAKHNYGQTECPYPPNALPFGANIWVRRELLNKERKFGDEIGPKPGNYIMGSETTFLKQLTNDGYGIIYAPDAVVGHRIQPWQLTKASIRRKAYRYGRGIAHWQGLRKKELLKKHPLLWSAIRVAAIVKYSFIYLLAMLSPIEKHRVVSSSAALKSLGYNIESLTIAGNKKAKENV